jgi:excinuclease ABC subunit C
MAEFDTYQAIKNKLERIPEQPGVYQYFGIDGEIIYVGKAKNLKKRVMSYFNKDHHDSPKTKILVKKIRDIQYIVVADEEDALLLENNLIKEYKPKYNILLKDDKTYPSICIKKEPFPRIFQTRKIEKDGSEYFGPYSNASIIRALLQSIRNIYPIRTCKLPLLEKDIKQGKYKSCLELQIKKCMGPCIGLQQMDAYMENIREIREILKGNTALISKKLFNEMQNLSKDMKFEEAHQIKNKYDLIEQFKSKSTVVNTKIDQIEVYSYAEIDQTALVNHLFIVQGCIVRGLTLDYKKKVEESKESVLSSAIFEIQSRFNNVGKKVIVPFEPEMKAKNIEYILPTKGDYKKLYDLSVQNVKQYKVELLKQKEKLHPEQRSIRILSTLKADLQLSSLPLHIECFDNSNIQGQFPVSACVVFKNAKPSKKDYRHFNIRTVEGPNDFASMEEVLHRRYERILHEEGPLPQLIIVDGGKGQLSSAVSVLETLGINHKIAIIGIAKNLEEIFFPYDSVPIYLNKDSESLKLIQHLRDEAHRFGISHHRNQRSKAQTHSILDDIKGVGPSTKIALFQHFKTIQQMRKASLEEMEKVVGKQKSRLIKDYFEQQ